MKTMSYFNLLYRSKCAVFLVLLFLYAGTVKTGTLTTDVYDIKGLALSPVEKNLFEGYQETLYDVIEKYRGVFSVREVEIIILTESEGIANAVSSGGEQSGIGLMQISSVALKDFNKSHATAYQMADLYDPFTNIEIGCWVLNQYHDSIRNPDFYKVYNAYNVGLYNHRSYYKHYATHEYPDGKPYNSLKRLAWAIAVYDTRSWRLTL